MAYFVGPFTSTYYTRIYCERNSDYTPIFRDFRLNGYIPPPPGPEDEEDEDEYEDECEFDKYIYEEEQLYYYYCYVDSTIYVIEPEVFAEPAGEDEESDEVFDFSHNDFYTKPWFIIFVLICLFGLILVIVAWIYIMFYADRKPKSNISKETQDEIPIKPKVTKLNFYE